MEIREGTLAEALDVLVKIDEFEQGETLASMTRRIGDKPSLVLVADDGNELVGVNIGYQLDDDCFYSWLGGVTAKSRRKGIAKALMNAQEDWVKIRGYQTIRVKSRNCFPETVSLLLTRKYQVEHLEKQGSLDQYRLHFVKLIT
ncbi:GNAT family N-acetyltransferase [Veronia nyctiphanis]|uniref:GNAT family N-acetyltransferase n=1 Tax=Veronia nyctiphanis TaxID=1278244 RepID=A0A4Q0YTY3_9GAMM|nr:GNAT family N-acetyltransferase [Veronia nyctiphanis]RXJ72639.1 GNAT family N-acetyltransferase [Veronia nyctiphanis]